MAKRRKASKNTGKKPAKKSAKSRKKRMGKPARKAGKAPKKAHKTMSPRKTARKIVNLAVRKPQQVMTMLPPAFAAMVRGRNRESIVSVLVVLFMLFATLSAGYFYPQPKAPGIATPAIMLAK